MGACFYLESHRGARAVPGSSAAEAVIACAVMLGMVFAAGLGTRLRPLTEVLPKPAVPLMNRPLASYALERLAALGVERVAVNTHHLAGAVERELGAHVPAGLHVHFVHERELLGTGGGLKNALARLIASTERSAAERPVAMSSEGLGGSQPPDTSPTGDGGIDEVGASEPIVVMNGDIFFWPDLEGAIALHRELDAVATVVLRADPRARQLGALDVDDTGRVRRLLGAPEVDLPLRERMFTGVHVLSARALADLPAEGCIIRRAYRRWIDEGAVVGGFDDEGAWRDLGTPAEYLRASLDLLRGELRWPGWERPADGVLVDASATVGEGARLTEVVVGAGARIDPGVRLERAIVWPGTHVREDARDAILAPHARVQVGA